LETTLRRHRTDFIKPQPFDYEQHWLGKDRYEMYPWTTVTMTNHRLVRQEPCQNLQRKASRMQSSAPPIVPLFARQFYCAAIFIHQKADIDRENIHPCPMTLP
jgi:hypothetical protein